MARNAAKKEPRYVPVRAADPPKAATPASQAPSPVLKQEDDWLQIQRLYTELKANGERYKPLWDRISQLVGISVEPDYLWSNENNKSTQLDEFVDDPTAALSVNQAGDYLRGIMWGTGEDVLDIVPSRYVTELVDAQIVQPWYDFATSQLLYHMNHPHCGYLQALAPYSYDQFSYGNSGIGIFRNDAFKQGIDENCLLAREYGIDNTRIKSGKSGAPDVGSVIYHWSCSRIVAEFCLTSGAIDVTKFNKLPTGVKNAYNNGNINQEFDLIFMWMPRADYDPQLKGRRGTKWRGVWFFDEGSGNKLFVEDSYAERPINWTRMIRVRGEDYGRSSGTLLLSSISSLNYMFAITQDILEKMANPALGTWGNSVFGDGVLDTSPNGLTIFNATQLTDKGLPIFPIHDVGDPEGIIKFLMPYLEGKITTAFKVDALLDFNSAKDMTATESLQRYNIRGKSLSGMLGQQKTERLIPDVRRSISICWEVGELGVNPALDPMRANRLKSVNKTERIIPQEVLDVAASGKPWFELRFNNELEKLLRTEHVQSLTQIIQGVTAIAALYPDIIHAIKWYDLLKYLNDNLDADCQIMVTANEFKKIIAQAAADRQQAMQLQAAQVGAAAQNDMAAAGKNTAQAGAIRNGQAAATAA